MRLFSVFLLLTILIAGCRVTLPPIHDPPHSLAVTASGPWRSMIYLARTDSGVVVIDLGWFGGEGTLRRALRQIDAEPADVSTVVLTHSHRDHVVGWRALTHATFVMGDSEVSAFTGRTRHGGRVPRLGEWLLATDLPRHGEVVVQGLSRDTVLLLGSDTLRAYQVPGHTAGSVVYLFRGILFVGDALSWSLSSGFRPDRTIHSDDSAQNRRNVEQLWTRLPEGAVHWVCTAHARCTRFTEEFPEQVRQ